jgi:hypothetical protein
MLAKHSLFAFQRKVPNSLVNFRRFTVERKLIGRYTDVTPIQLFRIQQGTSVKLRDKAVQVLKNRAAYDLSVHDGLVYPANGDIFIG